MPWRRDLCVSQAARPWAPSMGDLHSLTQAGVSKRARGRSIPPGLSLSLCGAITEGWGRRAGPEGRVRRYGPGAGGSPV